jgi:hypothetical protein
MRDTRTIRGSVDRANLTIASTAAPRNSVRSPTFLKPSAARAPNQLRAADVTGSIRRRPRPLPPYETSQPSQVPFSESRLLLLKRDDLIEPARRISHLGDSALPEE